MVLTFPESPLVIFIAAFQNRPALPKGWTHYHILRSIAIIDTISARDPKIFVTEEGRIVSNFRLQQEIVVVLTPVLRGQIKVSRKGRSKCEDTQKHLDIRSWFILGRAHTNTHSLLKFSIAGISHCLWLKTALHVHGVIKLTTLLS